MAASGTHGQTQAPVPEARIAWNPRDLAIGGGLLGAWLLIVACVGPGGDFALNDDWAYARAVRGWWANGALERVPWIWVPALTHAVVGIGATAGGFSTEALRASTLVLGFAGIAGTYVLVRQVGADPGWAALAAAVVGTNPIYVNLAFTYMTDVPFTAWATWSLVLAIAALRGSRAAMVGTLLFGAALVFYRQTGLALPIAVGCAVALGRPRDAGAWLLALALAAVAGAAYVASAAYLANDPSARFFALGDAVAEVVASDHRGYTLARNGTMTGIYLGAFLLPALAWCRRALGAPEAVAFGVGCALSVAAVAALGLSVPPGANILHTLGTGPLAWHGTAELPSTLAAPWWLLSACGGGAAAAGLVGVARRGAARGLSAWTDPALLVPLAFVVAYLAPHLTRSPMFDRYLLPCLAPLLAVFAIAVARPGDPGRREPDRARARSRLPPRDGVVLGRRRPRLSRASPEHGRAGRAGRRRPEPHRRRPSLQRPAPDAARPHGRRTPRLVHPWRRVPRVVAARERGLRAARQHRHGTLAPVRPSRLHLLRRDPQP